MAALPGALIQTLELGRTGALSALFIIALVVGVVVVVAVVVFMETAQRRIIVQYPKRQVGNRMYGGEASHLPLKINTSGVIPPIFASSLLLFPATIASFQGSAGEPGWVQWIATYLARHRFNLAISPDRFLLLHTTSSSPGRHGDNLKITAASCPHPSGQEHREYLDYPQSPDVVGALYLRLLILPELLIARAACRSIRGTSC